MILTLPHGRFVECRDGTHDELVFRESWPDDTYRMTTLPKPHGGYALDLGANVGAWSTLAATAGAQVIAVECWRENITRMVANVDAFDLGELMIIEAAVTGRHVHEKSVLVGGDGAEVQTSIFVGEALPRVPAIHIDELLMMRERWWCMKVDIEGDEYEVLNAATPGLLNRVDYIVGEFHGPKMSNCFDWIDDAQYGELMTTLAGWGNITTMGLPERGGNFFGHRYGVEAPVVPAEHVPIQTWLR